MSDRWVWMNDQLMPESQAMLPITDRGFLFGEGVFTTIRVSNGKCEFIKMHLQRLQEQAQFLNLSNPHLTIENLNELIRLNHAQQGIWRLKIILTAGSSHPFLSENLIVTLHPYIPQKDKNISVCLYPYPLDTPLAKIKSLAYLDHLYVGHYAQQRGYADAITMTKNKLLLETSCSNLFWIDEGQCWIPDLNLPYLKGIILQNIIKNFPLPIQFIKAKIEDISPHAHIYTCNALTHVRPVIAIEERSFKRHIPLETLIHQTLMEALHVANQS